MICRIENKYKFFCCCHNSVLIKTAVITSPIRRSTLNCLSELIMYHQKCTMLVNGPGCSPAIRFHSEWHWTKIKEWFELWYTGTHLDRVKRIWYLSHMRAAKVQASLRIRAVSPEPSLLAHTSSESRGTFKQKARSLALLNGWACAVKICYDGMLEDTNSLDGAHLSSYTCTYYLVTFIMQSHKITAS